MFELTGKTALVTGATGPIGGSIARVLHAQGATVAISGTRRDALDQLAGELGRRPRVAVQSCRRREPRLWSRAPKRRAISFVPHAGHGAHSFERFQARHGHLPDDRRHPGLYRHRATAHCYQWPDQRTGAGRAGWFRGRHRRRRGLGHTLLVIAGQFAVIATVLLYGLARTCNGRRAGCIPWPTTLPFRSSSSPSAAASVSFSAPGSAAAGRRAFHLCRLLHQFRNTR